IVLVVFAIFTLVFTIVVLIVSVVITQEDDHGIGCNARMFQIRRTCTIREGSLPGENVQSIKSAATNIHATGVVTPVGQIAAEVDGAIEGQRVGDDLLPIVIE